MYPAQIMVILVQKYWKNNALEQPCPMPPFQWRSRVKSIKQGFRIISVSCSACDGWRCVFLASSCIHCTVYHLIYSEMSQLWPFGPLALFPPLMLSALPAHIYVQLLPAYSKATTFFLILF